MFSDSHVKLVSPYRFTESAVAMPPNIYPVFVGSGNIVFSIDASGMQGLNNRMQKAYNGWQNAADMYVVGQGMVGDTFKISMFGREWNKNTIPYGFFDYSIEYDSKMYGAEDILLSGSMFRRDNDILHATVKTSYILANRVRVEIEAVTPLDGYKVIFKIRTKNFVPHAPSCDDVHALKLNVSLNLKTREGKPIFKTSRTESGVHLSVKGYEQYERDISAKCTNGQFSFADDVLMLSCETSAQTEWNERIFMFAFDGKAELSECGQIIDKHIADWKNYYDSHTKISLDNPEEVFMFNNSLYIFRMGYNSDFGYPIGHPFSFPACWEQCMFWDMHFQIDSMMRAGSRDVAKKLTIMLKKIMRKDGKPFPWMFIYDGTTFLSDDRDIAPLVICTHAMTAIRYYEYTRDEKMLMEIVYPILERCSSYAVKNMFTLEGDRYIIGAPVSNDVVDEGASEINQTFTTLWFAVILKKTADYSRILNKKFDCLYDDIPDKLYLENDGNEYFHCRGESAKQAKWASWIPFLAYPTEGMPFLDEQMLKRTKEKYNYVELYKEKQNCYQPWTECIEAQADHRAGDNENAYRLIRTSLTRTFGNGYFAEVGPQMQTCGYPPYISAHSSYISAFIDAFFSTSVWDDSCSLFMNMPEKYLSKTINITKTYGSRNICLESAQYSPLEVTASFSGSIEGRSFTVKMPDKLSEEDMRLFVNGKEHSFEYSQRRRYIKFIMPQIQKAEISVF